MTRPNNMEVVPISSLVCTMAGCAEKASHIIWMNQEVWSYSCSAHITALTEDPYA